MEKPEEEFPENSPDPDPDPPNTSEHQEEQVSLVPTDALQQYIESIKRYPLLTREEEHELAEKYLKEKDVNAAYKLVTSNLLLVVKIAFEFRNQFQNMLDLIQEGNIGLMYAVKRFDPFKGTRLPTYASYWIRAYILKYILDNWRLVKVGTTNIRRKLLYNLKAVQEQLANAGFEPGPKQLAEHFGTTEENVLAVQQGLNVSDLSLDEPIHSDSERTLMDKLHTEKAGIAEEVEIDQMMELLRTKIAELSTELKETERVILEKRILSENPMTLQEIGNQFGVSREAVRQSEKKLLARLKEYLTEEIPELSEMEFHWLK